MYLFSVRVDVESQRILSSKQMKLSDIESDLQRLYQIDSNSILKTLWHILRMMQKFPHGEYLLRHEQKHNNQVMVYTKIDERYLNMISILTYKANK